ncbi:MAG: hypothetical protein F4139_08875 [Gemmatimonadetes bacterium]|nr:hypothetical protein [Gemmatimonadota bacterium]
MHDPTAETTPATRRRRPPPASLHGRTVALLDIGKHRSSEFLDHLESRLHAMDIATARFAKPTNAKPAATALLDEIAERADVVAEALAD